MKKTVFPYLFMAILLGSAFLVSCTPDAGPSPKTTKGSGTPSLGADYDGVNANGEHPTIQVPCSGLTSFDLVDQNGNKKHSNFPEEYGVLEAVNDHNSLFLMAKMGRNWLTEHAYLWMGDNLDRVQLNGSGQVDPELFAYNFPIPVALGTWVLTIDHNTLPARCTKFLVNLKLYQLNGFFGGPNQASRTSVWVSGERVANAWAIEHCWLDCADPMTLRTGPGAAECSQVYPGFAPLDCQTLSVAIDGGNAPFTYLWNTGETGSSIRVCPTVTTTYSVLVTDARGTKENLSFVVNAINGAVPGKPHKVVICHFPPGNPANMQTIEIAKSALPAHVAAFRTPQSPPNQGHDSGCRIGRCDAIVCR